MPLIGVVDPTLAERKRDEPGRLPRWLTTDEVLAEAATLLPNKTDWPYELLNACLGAWQERDYVSVTSLVGGCMRAKVLERKEDYVYTVDEMYAATRGVITHDGLESRARENSLVEARFFTSIQLPKSRRTVEVSGSPDIITWNPNTIGDYKTTEKAPNHYPWVNHKQQVQIYQWLVRHATHWEKDGEAFDIPFDPREWKAEALYITYLEPKGPKQMAIESMQDWTTPKGTKTRRKQANIWPDEEVEDLIVPRLASFVAALDAYPEWPFTAEAPGFEGPAGWGCPGKPWCNLPMCLAKRYPNGLRWENADEEA